MKFAFLLERRQTFIFMALCCCFSVMLVPMSIWVISEEDASCSGQTGALQVIVPRCRTDDDCKLKCNGVCSNSYNGNVTMDPCLNDAQCDFGKCENSGLRAAIGLTVTLSLFTAAVCVLCIAGFVKHGGKSNTRPYAPLNESVE